jgi:antitoxin component of MazEF toxin-antitoxin module
MVNKNQINAIKDSNLVREVYKGGNGLNIYFSRQVLALYGLTRGDKVQMVLRPDGILIKPMEER